MGMRPGQTPRSHLFVCENVRHGSPLGPGCGARGTEVATTLRDAVLRSGIVQHVWVTSTRCLGLCPKKGTAVALYPHGGLFVEVTKDDCKALLSLATEPKDSP